MKLLILWFPNELQKIQKFAKINIPEALMIKIYKHFFLSINLISMQALRSSKEKFIQSKTVYIH